MGALILMIFTSVYGFNNMPRSFYSDGIMERFRFFLLSAVVFFCPICVLWLQSMARPFKDEKGGTFFMDANLCRNENMRSWQHSCGIHLM